MTVTTLTLLALATLAVVFSASFISREQSVLRPVRVKRRVRSNAHRRPRG